MSPEIITLKDFVRESLLELVSGVTEAQEKLPPGARINPPGSYIYEGKILAPINPPNPAMNPSSVRTGTLVEFDLAVTATQKGSSQGGVGVFFPGVTAGGRAGQGTEEVVANRMKFTVSVFYTEA